MPNPMNGPLAVLVAAGSPIPDSIDRLEVRDQNPLIEAKHITLLKSTLPTLAIAFTAVCPAQTTAPDLTEPGAIAAIKAKTDIPKHVNTYNLGSTGLRGWIRRNWSRTAVGQITDASRPMVVTTASPPTAAPCLRWTISSSAATPP